MENGFLRIPCLAEVCDHFHESSGIRVLLDVAEDFSHLILDLHVDSWSVQRLKQYHGHFDSFSRGCRNYGTVDVMN